MTKVVAVVAFIFLLAAVGFFLWWAQSLWLIEYP